MKIAATTLLSIVLILVSGCSAGISRTGYKLPENQNATTLQWCPIVVQFNATLHSNDIVILGSIHAYDTGLSQQCDESYVLDLFCKEGCKLGADLVNITEEKQPDFWSTCYRAKAEFVRFKDREKIKGLSSDAKYAPYLSIEQLVSPNLKGNSPFNNYDVSIHDSIKKSWFALLDGQKIAQHRRGKVILQFHLNYDGQITDMKILEDTAGKTLAKFCTEAVLAQAPYPPWPKDMIRMVGANYRIITFSFYYY